MAEIWGAAIAAGGALLSAYSSNKQKDKDKKDAAKERVAATKDEALYTGILSQFEADQDYYYEQKKRQNTERGLDQFRAYNTQGQANTSRIVVPARPTIVGALEQANTLAAEAAQRQGNNGGLFATLDNAENRFRRILDPVGASISRKDPVRRALKKLF